ncbi:hypothetical protein AURDEDRAFT_158851 [Auricularia subglabra TFB-10046 SS5]|nr:hypothetical protein AURDEDRAFT_158851 [Auricularia subglabra TFB-10046 SS5]
MAGRLRFEAFYSALRSAASPEPSQAAVQAWWKRVHDAYDREEQRHYHTLAHITAMWDAFMQWKGDAEFQALLSEDPAMTAMLLFAVVFHEQVDGFPADPVDVDRLATIIASYTTHQLNVRDDIAAHTSQLILATISHRIPDDDSARYPACLPLFLDLDLEVLSRPRDAYTAYAAQIHAEYAHVSPEDFRKGRSAVLRSLSQGDIYFTRFCQEHLRDAARANLEWEIGQLEAGTVG